MRYTSAPKKGIDVSRWQEDIDWQSVKASGIEFAIIRLGAGKNEDAMFRRNAKACAEAGIPIGAYIYSYALDEAEAREEANLAYGILSGIDLKLGLWFDMEDADGYKARKGFSFEKEKVTDICRAFVQTAKRRGMENVGIYASKSWFGSLIDEVSLGVPVWVAQWGEKLTYPSKAAMWQYSSNGSVPGIDTAVDLDLCFFEFDASCSENSTVPCVLSTDEVVSVLEKHGIITDKAMWMDIFIGCAWALELAKRVARRLNDTSAVL